MTERLARAEAAAKLGEIVKRKAVELRVFAHSMQMLADMGEPLGKTVTTLKRCCAADDVGEIVTDLERFLATPAKTRERLQRKREEDNRRLAQRRREIAKEERARREEEIAAMCEEHRRRQKAETRQQCRIVKLAEAGNLIVLGHDPGPPAA